MTTIATLTALIDSKSDFDPSAFSTEDITAVYEAKLEKQMAKMSRVPEDERRLRSVVALAKANPKMHQAYLASCNPGKKAQRMLAEKYDR
jgi:hypothetical protein